MSDGIAGPDFVLLGMTSSCVPGAALAKHDAALAQATFFESERVFDLPQA